MEEMASLWGYEEVYNNQQNEMEQLGQKLLFTTLELENIKSQHKEETRKNNEYVYQLTHLLKLAIQERNEAINQLQTILNLPTIPDPTKPVKTNSSITESNSYNSVFDAVSSYAEFSDINHINSNRGLIPKFDEGSLIIEGIALPEKGKFLRAVVEAGPLLQTLIVAGSMPRWRNPPQIQTYQIPPVSIMIRGGSRSFNTDGFVSLAKRHRFC